MTENTINIYCDESCHLEHDGKNIMVLGGVWAPLNSVSKHNEAIREIKQKHGLPRWHEFKWTKVSAGKKDFYIELVNYFFAQGDLHFRGLIAQDKQSLDHTMIAGQTHDQWYYKMYFTMLKQIFDTHLRYNIYLDIKDTRGGGKVRKLQEVVQHSLYDFDREIIKKIQIIRSHETELMQMADLLIGALSYLHRGEIEKEKVNPTKKAVVNRIQELSGLSLKKNTLLRQIKFNLFLWHPRQNGAEN
jgi:hypothetical protein